MEKAPISTRTPKTVAAVAKSLICACNNEIPYVAILLERSATVLVMRINYKRLS